MQIECSSQCQANILMIPDDLPELVKVYHILRCVKGVDHVLQPSIRCDGLKLLPTIHATPAPHQLHDQISAAVDNVLHCPKQFCFCSNVFEVQIPEILQCVQQ